MPSVTFMPTGIVYVAGWSVNSIGDHAAGRPVMLGDVLERNADGGVAVLVTPWHMAVQHVGLVPPHDDGCPAW